MRTWSLAKGLWFDYHHTTYTSTTAEYRDHWTSKVGSRHGTDVGGSTYGTALYILSDRLIGDDEVLDEDREDR
jgi:hypothetical protein